MEQYVVPQFIDVESKIIGPITTKQFVIMIVWGLFTFLAYKLLDITGFILFFLFWTGINGLLGFYKVNGRPFYIFALIMIQGKKRPPLRVWKHEPISDKEISKKDKKKASSTVPVGKRHAERSRLSELSLIVDTGGKYQGDVLAEPVIKKEDNKADTSL